MNTDDDKNKSMDYGTDQTDEDDVTASDDEEDDDSEEWDSDDDENESEDVGSSDGDVDDEDEVSEDEGDEDDDDDDDSGDDDVEESSQEVTVEETGVDTTVEGEIAAPSLLEGSDSDSEDVERCPICLNRFRDQDVGTPECCDHIFCLECIVEWSKNVNTCPQDRLMFKLILCKHGVDDIIYKKIPVADVNTQADDGEAEEPTYCEVCVECDREDRLLLCDGCDHGYHLECLTPPLTRVPVNEWFCPSCARRDAVQSAEDADFEMNRGSRPRRQIARTRVMERVRTAIEEHRLDRLQRYQRQHRALLSSSEGEEDGEVDPNVAEVVEMYATAAAAGEISAPARKPRRKATKRKSRKTKTTRKRRSASKKTGRRKSTSRKSPGAGSGKKTSTKRTRRKTRGKKGKRKYGKGKRPKRLARTARPVPATTPKSRIAGALGLLPPPKGRTIPLQKSRSEASTSDLGTSLSIFGNKDDLIDFSDEHEEPGPSGAQPVPSTSKQGTSKYSRHALSSYRPLGRVPVALERQVKRCKPVEKATPAASSGACGGPLDLLGAIMESQNQLKLDSKLVTINRDGSLTHKPKDLDTTTTKTSPSDSNKKPSDQPSSSSGGNLFKSSFKVVDEKPDCQISVLDALEEDSKKVVGSFEEEYDPAHPTDELEDDLLTVGGNAADTGVQAETKDTAAMDEDVYDPAHPTDDISSDDEQAGTAVSGTTDEDKLEKVEQVAASDIKVENKLVDSDLGADKNAERGKKGVKDMFGTDDEDSRLNSSDAVGKTETNERSESKVKDIVSPESKKDLKKIDDTTDDRVQPQSDSSQAKQSPTKCSPDKVLKLDTTRSHSIKITEPTKKSPSSAKPFEINRMALFEKKRLYGGEKDSSVKEGLYSDTFTLTEREIEEVFKDTSKKGQQSADTKPKEAAVAEETSVKLVEKSATSNVCDPKQKVTVLVGNDAKENIVIEKKVKVDTPLEGNIDNKGAKVDTEFKSRKSKDKEDKPGKRKAVEVEVDSSFSKKKMSDRFKNIQKDKKDMDNLEEEDPIHEMRKLDKELSLEFGDTDFVQKKDKESKKGKRKVSVDNEEGVSEKLRHRRDSRRGERTDSDYMYSYDEKEEGEVDEEGRRDKRRKDKRRKKLANEDEDIMVGDIKEKDKRIVVKVSHDNEDRTVWEEDEKKRKRKEEKLRKEEERLRKEEERIKRELEKEDRKREMKREKKNKRRSRSRSHDRRGRSRSRERRRSRSRDRSRRKHKDRSRSRSRDRSFERSHKKKKKDRNRSRERSRERRGRNLSRERERSHERVRDWSPDESRERDWSVEHGRHRERNRSREVSAERVDMFGRSRSPFTRKEFLKDKEMNRSKTHRAGDALDFLTSLAKKPKYDEVSSTDSEKMSEDEEHKIETVSRIEGRKETGPREPSYHEDNEEKDDEFDDEPEETEQFQYTDRDEFLGQNKSKQHRQNLITIAHSENGSSSSRPPLPKPLPASTPPIPPGSDFTQFPPPPAGPPPPPGPPPGSVILSEPPPGLHVPPGAPPGPGILGERPILIQGPPPTMEGGAGLIQQGPGSLSLLPPGFHRGLPPTISPQRGIIVSPMRQAVPRLQRLASPGNPRFGWQVTTSAEIIPSQFGGRVPSPGRFPGPQIVNGPFEGLPPPNSEHLPFPPMSGGEPAHLITISTANPPPNVVQIPVSVDESGRPLGPPPGAESQLIQLGPDPRAPPPRLPIPLLPSTAEPPPMSVMASMPPPNAGLMSAPGLEPFTRTMTPPSSVSAILDLARMGSGPLQVPATNNTTILNGSSNGELSNPLGKINEILNTQAKLFDATNKDKLDTDKDNESGRSGVFKVPLPPGTKQGKNEVGTTEVIDMDMGSPINEEGNIELPVSPQFDNLIDNPEDLLEEDFNKKMQQKLNEKDKEKDKELNKDKPATPSKVKELKDQEGKKDSPKKTKEERHERHKHTKENKPEKGHRSKHQRHHKTEKADALKDLKEKALKDAHLDLDAQDMPSSAVEMTNKEKYLKKLHLQERVVEEVKMAIKPFYSSKKIDKHQYKEILRKAVPKICHSKSGNINPMKIKNLVEAYVEKLSSKDGKHRPSPTHDSPAQKANGERTAGKTAR